MRVLMLLFLLTAVALVLFIIWDFIKWLRD